MISVAPASPDPPTAWDPPVFVRLGLCAAWSSHAAELAVPLGAQLERWPESPAVESMVRDGLLTRILPGVLMPPDLLSGAISRVLALGCALGEHLHSTQVVAGASAAWVLLGGTPPHPAELLSSAHRMVLSGVVVRTARLLPREVETLGGAPLTVPTRTCVDLLRFAPAESAAALVGALLESGHVTEAEIAGSLGRISSRHPGLAQARLRFETLERTGAAAA